MSIKSRRRVMTISLLGLAILLLVFIHYHRLTIYTASLATRPFNIGLLGPIHSLEPGQVAEHEERLLASTLYEGLVQYDEKSGEIKPLLARSWKYSADGKNLTINLKRNIRFHNGKKLQAQDVKASWEGSFSHSKDWTNLANLFLPVTGGSGRIEGKASDISGIQVINPYTIKVSFDHPNTVFIYMLSNPIFWVYDSEAAGVSPAPGTGPFILRENKDNKHFILLRNDKYHRGMPPLTALEVQVYDDGVKALEDYKAGKIDYLDQVPLEEIKNIQKAPLYKDRFIYHPVLYTYSLGFNMNKAPFINNYFLRRAFNYAIDRQTIADKVLGGGYRPIKGALPAGILGFDPHMRGYSFNQDKARQLLDEAGYSEGQGLAPLVIGYDAGVGHREVLETIAGQLAQIGVQVQLQPMDWEYYKKQVGGMHMSCFRQGWQADYPDADSFLYNLFHTSRIGISNYYAYNNPQVDKLLDASRSQPGDSSKRLQLINRAEQIVLDDAPCLWLFQKMAAKLIGSGVKNLTVDKMEMIDWYKVELHKPSLEESEKPVPAKKN